MADETLKLKDRYSGNPVWLTIRDGIVVGCMGADPKRYIGMTVEIAKHYAKHGGSVAHARSLSEQGASWRADRKQRRYGGVRPGGRNDV